MKKQTKKFDAETAINELRDLVLSLAKGTPEKANGNAKKGSKKAKAALSPEQSARKAKNAKLNEQVSKAIEEAENRTWKDAVSLARKQIAHNEREGFENAAIAKTTPTSQRRYLTTAQNRAFKSVRDRNGITAKTAEKSLA